MAKFPQPRLFVARILSLVISLCVIAGDTYALEQPRPPTDGTWCGAVRSTPAGWLILLTLVDIAFIAGFVTIRVVHDRAAFYRRNQAGLEVFRSYGHMLWTKFVWGVLGLVAIALIPVFLFLSFILLSRLVC